MGFFDWVLAGFLVGPLLIWLWRRRTLRATECGHSTKIEGSFTAFGETLRGRLPMMRGKTPYCHACVGKMTIRCAWCARLIVVGHPVTLYPERPGVRMPDHTVVYIDPSNGERSYVGCMSCADDAVADVQGIWVPPGQVQRTLSLAEVILSAIKQGASAVIIRTK